MSYVFQWWYQKYFLILFLNFEKVSIAFRIFYILVHASYTLIRNLIPNNHLLFLFLPPFKDPKMYVQTVLDVHKKYNALVMSAFNNDAGFVAALDKVGLWRLWLACSICGWGVCL